ncbi:MAG TPA: twin-arginine translocation signal domain-containing protein [Armatimonadota bacterium]|nr:twin-arginine translocation signal domain-containing protein [Armatimonadota bacterium]
MKRGITRRSFVKVSAVAALGLGTGVTPVKAETAAPSTLTALPGRIPYTSETEGILLVTAVAPDAAGLTVRFELNGQPLIPARAITAGSPMAMPFSMAGLPNGPSSVTGTLSAGGQTVATATVEITKLPPAPNEVKIDVVSRGLIVGGLPFLPFGFYCHFPPGSLPDQEVVQGFSHLAPYQNSANGPTPDDVSAIRAVMDRTAAVGMKFVFDVRRLSRLPSSPDKLGKLQSVVEAFRGHPALLAWYTADEPNGGGIPPEPLIESYKLIKQLDPYHPVLIVLNDPGAAVAYAPAMDIIMADPYPIPNSPVTLVSDWAQRLIAGAPARLPLWIVPQAFGGGEWWAREPTASEERVMTYLALVHGATGIQYFIRRPPNHDPKSPVLWNECRKLALEAAELSAAILSPEARPAITATPAAIHAAAWQRSGLITAVAVNPTGAPMTFQLQLAGVSFTGSADLPFENRQAAVQNGHIEEMIDAMSTRVYNIPAGPAPVEDISVDPRNLTINPSFEEWANVGTPSGCYVSGGADAASTYFLDSRTARHGRHSLRLITPTAGKGIRVAPYPVAVTAGKSYRVSIWARADTAALPFSLSLGPVGSQQFNLTTDWKEFSFTGASQQTAKRGYLNLELIGAGTAWFDLLQVVPV